MNKKKKDSNRSAENTNPIMKWRMTLKGSSVD
jgi:hypothetical protein